MTLVLGFCPLRDQGSEFLAIKNPRLTLQIIRAVEKIDERKVLLIDLRKLRIFQF